MTVCPQCHTVHGDEHSFCQRCGNPLVPENKAPQSACPNCSGPVFPGQIFCTECGQRVKSLTGARTIAGTGGRDDLFYKSPASRTPQRAPAGRKGLSPWLMGLAGLLILVGVYYFWPKAPDRKPLVSPPVLPPLTAPERVDTLQRDVERLAERIRSAHMKKDMSLFRSCYSDSYPNLGELERQTYENWKNFDFRDVRYNISNVRRVGPNQAAAELVWNFQIFNNQTKAAEIHRYIYSIMLEDVGGSWKILESKDIG